MQTTTRHIAALTVVLCSSTAATVSAQDLSREEIQEFQRLSAEGAELYAAKDFEGSIARLQQAQEIYAHPDLQYNIGRAQLQLERCRAARATFDAYLQRDGLSEEATAAAQEQLELATTCKEDGTVVLACTDGAIVSLDGESVACGEPIVRKEGVYSLSATAPEYEQYSTNVTIEPGGSTEVQVELVRETVEAPAPQPAAPTWQRPVGYAAVGTGGALILGGLILDASSSGRADKLAEAADPAEVDRLSRGAKTARAVTLTMYIGGVVAAGTGAVLLLTAPSNDVQAAVLVRPSGLAFRLDW